MNKEIIIAIIIGSVLLIGLIITLIVIFKKKGSKRITIDQEFIDNLLMALGSISNVVNVKVDNGRLKFLVSDLDIIDFETLKKMSTAGVFITGNHIKMLFQYDANTIEKAVSNLIKNN